MAPFLQAPQAIRLCSLNPNAPFFSPIKPVTLFPCSANPFKTSSSPNPPEPSESLPQPVDPVKLAFEKAKAYRKSKPGVEAVQGSAGDAGVSRPSPAGGGGGGEQVQDAVKAAMEKVKEYKNNKGPNVEKGADLGKRVKVEKANNKDQLVVSSMDFVGLDFGDKKRGRGLPPGLVPTADTFSDKDIEKVEIIVGDTSSFGNSTAAKPKPVVDDANSETYKPKVSTWGVFPRPSNISKTYGGGKTIRPGQELETAEERAAKDARTRELLTAYKKRTGLNVDPKLTIECEKLLSEGDSFMDSGSLKEALPYYEKIMNKLPFKSKTHGLAALQWSICQDSLTRRDEARSMYEKLQKHPNPTVSKKARQFMFTFEAMEVLKVRNSRLASISTGYQNYFEAFVKDRVDYSSNNDDEAREVALIANPFPYLVFLLSPIFLVILAALQKGR